MRCSNSSFDRPVAWSVWGQVLRIVPVLCLVLLVAACASHTSQRSASRSYAPTHYYPPPGPSGDPWGPYIREAAGRYGVPEQWVRAVMRQESGGQQQAVSPVGAMGLMQLMPATYEELRDRYSLGSDPFDPHNNLLAGTAYIRELSDRYGAPGFLAAYNAGPGRVDRYLAGSSSLPTETVNYVAAITPNLGNSVPLSGPLAMYAGNQRRRAAPPTIASLASGCDPDAAYDPDHPCRPLEQVAAAPVRETGVGGCDLNAAYDPNRPCRPVTLQALYQEVASGCDPDAAYDSGRACSSGTTVPASVLTAGARQPPPRAATAGDWGIQVGAFSTPDLAQAVAESARTQAPAQLGAAVVSWPPTSIGGSVLYRARLIHLSASAASDACRFLNQRQLPCIVVQPAGA
jgi:D-alanyl-D-alanine carboxypeptidase